MAQGFGQVIPDDGQLEVIIASPRDRMGGFSVLSSLAKSAVLKNSANNADIICVRTSELHVTLPTPQTIVIDGEIEETDHMTVSVIQAALKVVAPIRLNP
jgi:diacylglycerol kinase family enzyme